MATNNHFTVQERRPVAFWYDTSSDEDELSSHQDDHLPRRPVRRERLSSSDSFVDSTDTRQFKTTQECLVCLVEKEKRQFLWQHTGQLKYAERRICSRCIDQYIVTSLQTKMSVTIPCPEPNCQTKFSSDKIRSVLEENSDKTLLEKYDLFLQKTFLDQNPNFVRCSHQCGSGQMRTDRTNPRVKCDNCGKLTCFFHNVPWHDRMTCAQYDEKHRMNDPNTKQYLNKNTKLCPGCQAKLEKTGGCDQMICTRCSTEFCWKCLGCRGPSAYPFRIRHSRTCSLYFKQRITLAYRSIVCTIL